MQTVSRSRSTQQALYFCAVHQLSGRQNAINLAQQKNSILQWFRVVVFGGQNASRSIDLPQEITSKSELTVIQQVTQTNPSLLCASSSSFVSAISSFHHDEGLSVGLDRKSQTFREVHYGRLLESLDSFSYGSSRTFARGVRRTLSDSDKASALLGSTQSLSYFRDAREQGDSGPHAGGSGGSGEFNGKETVGDEESQMERTQSVAVSSVWQRCVL